MSNSLQPKWVMILERSGSSLSINKQTDNKYMLEGIFAQFGVKNNNERIYQEKEYLPHLEYLQEKIGKKALFGELDHPEKFDISLKNVSHVIENLEYNKEKRQVTGKIRLLDTDAGRNAKALVDGGVQLSISSRAAGVVKENKEVEIKKIFTFDLVAEPGFANAQLNKIDESLGFHDENLAIYDMSNVRFSEEILGELHSDDANNENKNEKIDNMTDNPTFVTAKVLEAYTLHIQKQFQKVFQLIEEKTAPETTIGELKQYVETLAEDVKDLNKFSDYIGDRANTIARYAEYVLEKTDENAIKNEELDESLQEVRGYLDYTGNNINELASENEDLKTYTNYLKENLNVTINYAEHWANNTKFLYEHNDHLATQINNVANYLEYLKDGLNMNINYSEHIAENVGKNNIINNVPIEVPSTLNIKGKDLNSKIDNIIESAKKQKAESLSEQSTFSYFKILSESNQRAFLILEDNQKQKIIEAVAKSKPMNEQDFLSIWNETLNPIDPIKILEKYTDGMPEEYKPIWEKLDESKKSAILAKTKFYKMDTPYQVKFFWHGVKELHESIEMKSLNENYTAKTYSTYGSDYLKNIALGLQRLNK